MPRNGLVRTEGAAAAAAPESRPRLEAEVSMSEVRSPKEAEDGRELLQNETDARTDVGNRVPPQTELETAPREAHAIPDGGTDSYRHVSK